MDFFVENILGMIQELVSLETNLIEQGWIEQTIEKVFQKKLKPSSLYAISLSYKL